MHKKLFALAVAGLLLAPALSAVHAQVDQANYNNNGLLSYAAEGNGQTFTPSYPTSGGAGFFLTDMSQSGTVATLLVQLLTAPGGSLLASGTTTYSLGAGQSAWVKVYWSAASITPSTPYFLQMISDDSYTVATSYSYPDQYAGGGWHYNGSTNINSPYSDYTADGTDMTFEEYAGEVSSVPEPASMVLLATGLVGVFGIARRRNTKVA